MTPSYNQAHFLPATVASVLGQDYPHLQYVIQDGCSSDGTLELLETLPPTVAWTSEQDEGQSDAVNRGWTRTSGEVLGWLNSDDLYEPDALHSVGEVFAADPDLDWLVGRCRIIDTDGREVRRIITRYKNLLLDHLSFPLLLLENPISQMAVFVRRRALDAAGFLRTDLKYAMDYDLWLRLFRRTAPKILNTSLACFRTHSASKSTGGFRAQFAEEHQVAAEHARETGLAYLVPLHLLTAGKTVAVYAAVEAIGRLRGGSDGGNDLRLSKRRLQDR